MQSGKKPINRFEAIKPIHAERDDRCCRCETCVNELKLLAVAEVEQQVSGAVFSHRNRSIDNRRRIDWRQLGWRGSEHDDAGVVLRQPEDWGVRWVAQGVDREIATPIADGFSPSTLADRHARQRTLRNHGHTHRSGAATPRRGRMRLDLRYDRSARASATGMRPASSLSSHRLTKLREG